MRKQIPAVQKKLEKNREKTPSVVSLSNNANSLFAREMQEFVENYKQKRFLEIVEAAKSKKDGTKKKLNVPMSKIMGFGNQSEQTIMAAFGWYWEPLLHDLAFFEDMRDSVSLISGQVNKLVNLAMKGLKIQVEDPKIQKELTSELFNDQNIDFQESIRRSMVDLFSLGNCYFKPEWKRDSKGRLIPKVIRPIRATAIRKLRDDTLATEGYVQLLHRPSEFIMGGTPMTPTIYSFGQICCGIMRMQGWYAYGQPLLASLPFAVRLKYQMERDLAEMLHQHLPRIIITWSPEDQMDQDDVDKGLDDLKSKIASMRPTDNFATTPDTKIDYAGPQGKALDFASTQKHIEEQLYYVLPFTPSLMGMDSRNNPYDTQKAWTIGCNEAIYLRERIAVMAAPMLKEIADDWGCGEITLGYSDIDPENTQMHAETDEYVTNNAILKRDNGFIDQDTAARQATKHHPDGPVKKAAAPGKLPEPLDLNKSNDGDSSPNKDGKVRRHGPKGDGTKVPDKDKRPKGKRHSQMKAAIAYWTQQAMEEE